MQQLLSVVALMSLSRLFVEGGTSLTRKRTPLGAYCRHMPRVLGGSYRCVAFVMREEPVNVVALNHCRGSSCRKAKSSHSIAFWERYLLWLPVQGYRARKKTPTSLGLPLDPRQAYGRVLRGCDVLPMNLSVFLTF